MRSKADFPTLNTKLADGLRPGGKPYRVIVVEDKDFQKMQIAQILESESYEVVGTASNGQEALKLFDSLDKKIDLITTNLDMPVLDGYALMYELKQRKTMPLVVFISEETTKGVMKDLIDMGISDFILKPINRRILLERIKRAITKAAI